MARRAVWDREIGGSIPSTPTVERGVGSMPTHPSAGVVA